MRWEGNGGNSLRGVLSRINYIVLPIQQNSPFVIFCNNGVEIEAMRLLRSCISSVSVRTAWIQVRELGRLSVALQELPWLFFVLYLQLSLPHYPRFAVRRSVARELQSKKYGANIRIFNSKSQQLTLAIYCWIATDGTRSKKNKNKPKQRLI